MKKTLHVVITDPVEFAKGRIDWATTLFSKPQSVAKWINVCDVEVDFSGVDIGDLMEAAIDDVDRIIIEARNAFSLLMENLQGERSSLLALTHDVTGAE